MSYLHNVQYYETDAMKVAHHANYVKWMEEARVDFYKKAGFSYRQMESEFGIMIPVLFQSVEYRKMYLFDQKVKIVCKCEKFNGVKMNFKYLFYSDSDSEIHAVGITKHGFIDSNYEPVSLQQVYEEGYKKLKEAYLKNK